jgi:regulator of RNase E activity RraA
LPPLEDPLFDMMAEKLYVRRHLGHSRQHGPPNQVLQPGIVPAQPDARQVLVGRAATVLVGPAVRSGRAPYTNQISAIDALSSGDVVVSGVGG